MHKFHACKVGKEMTHCEYLGEMLFLSTICLFARGLYTPEVVQKALSTVGFERTLDDLNRFGAQTLREKHAFKDREGFDFDRLRLPKRIFETPSPAGPFDENFMRQALKYFKQNIWEDSVS